MTWHYQVMRHVDPEGDVWFGVHEYYPMPDGAGWTLTPIIFAETLDELKQMLKMIEQDIYRHGVKDYEV